MPYPAQPAKEGPAWAAFKLYWAQSDTAKNRMAIAWRAFHAGWHARGMEQAKIIAGVVVAPKLAPPPALSGARRK